MNFERGQDPKQALGIGIIEKVKQSISKAIEKYQFNLCNTEIRNKVKKEIEDRVGISIKIETRKSEDGEWYVDVEISPPTKVIAIDVKITRVGLK